MFFINIVLVGPKEIRSLNRKYRKLDKEATVLSFNYYSQGQAMPAGRLAESLLGEIVICPQAAKKQNLKIEKLVIHGLRNILSEIPTTALKRIGLGRSQFVAAKSR